MWFCVDPDGHIQATGRDAKGRKQYRYHAEWQRAREEEKFDSLVDFGQGLEIYQWLLGGLTREPVVETSAAARPCRSRSCSRRTEHRQTVLRSGVAAASERSGTSRLATSHPARNAASHHGDERPLLRTRRTRATR